MTSSILLAGAIILGAFDGDGARARPSDLNAYKSAAAEVRRDPNAHIRLALWCEAHGLSAERVKHLSLAILYDPKNTLARGLMGLVSYEGKWKRAEQVIQSAQDDHDRKAQIKEYLDRRAKTRDRAQDQWKLALWCEENGLKPQASAHLHQVVRLDPARDAAWKRLGFKKIGGHWDKPERLAAVKAEAQQQHKANEHWRVQLAKWREALSSRNKSKRAEAETSLSEVTDPRAVPAIWSVFAQGELPAPQQMAVKLLGQVDSPGSSRALAVLALTSPAAEARQYATQTLRRRDPRDFAALLVAQLGDPIKYEVRKVDGPGSQGVLLIKNPEANLKRLYSPPPAPNIPLQAGDTQGTDADGLPVIYRQTPFGERKFLYEMLSPRTSIATVEAMFGMNAPVANHSAANRFGGLGLPSAVTEKLGALMTPSSHQTPLRIIQNGSADTITTDVSVAGYRDVRIPIGQMTLEAQRAAEAAQQQLARDVQGIDAYNTTIREANQSVRQVLSGAVGTDLGEDRLSWEKWRTDLSGYAYVSPTKIGDDTPTYEEEVPLDYQPQPVAIISGPPQYKTLTISRVQHNCFAAGTPVQTMDGLRSIEKLRVGDQVLTQDPKSGELKYQPLLTVYHNPPNETLRIGLGAETIVATGIHRLWKAGKGWTMARDIKPGDKLRTLEGLAVVKSIEQDRVQPVFNMEVADGESFFVGNQRVLAHDNSYVNPTPSPFDAVTDLGATTRP